MSALGCVTVVLLVTQTFNRSLYSCFVRSCSLKAHCDSLAFYRGYEFWLKTLMK